MSAFEVYVWLTLTGFMTFISIISFVGMIPAGVVALFSRIEAWDTDEEKRVARMGNFWMKVLLPVFLISALFPSKETIALMYVLPELTNPDVVGVVSDEAKEVYGIAKEALKKMAEGD